MKQEIDLLVRVQGLLGQPGSVLRNIAAASGMSFSTVIRIRDGMCDPAYGKVLALARTFGLRPPLAKPGKATAKKAEARVVTHSRKSSR